jgi:F0F1-type ATP synthase membrane subunit b/b'
MKLTSVITTGVSVPRFPALAFCGENAAAAQSGSWFALLFYVINFSLFVVIIVRYAGPAIKGFFRDRAVGIRQNMQRADSALLQAQERASRAAEQMSGLDAEKAKIASEMADETVYQVGRIYDMAQEAVARLKRDTALTSAALRESGLRHVREVMALAAGEIARELIVRNFESADQSRLLEQFTAKLNQEAGR